MGKGNVFETAENLEEGHGGADRFTRFTSQLCIPVKSSPEPTNTARCGGRGPSCVELLNHPASVLSDRSAWPNHLCYDEFLTASTQRWAIRSVMFRRGNAVALGRWRASWPLPVGLQAVEALNSSPGSFFEGDLFELGTEDLNSDTTSQDTLVNLVPFEGDEEAIWALRVEGKDSVLELFGLTANQAEPEGRGRNRREGAAITPGELAWVLRGKDTSLIGLLDNARRWWSRFFGSPIPGRPRDSGTFASGDDFEETVHDIIRTLRSQQRKVTQESVSQSLNCDPRQLRRWLKHYSVGWTDVVTKR